MKKYILHSVLTNVSIIHDDANEGCDGSGETDHMFSNYVLFAPAVLSLDEKTFIPILGIGTAMFSLKKKFYLHEIYFSYRMCGIHYTLAIFHDARMWLLLSLQFWVLHLIAELMIQCIALLVLHLLATLLVKRWNMHSPSQLQVQPMLLVQYKFLIVSHKDNSFLLPFC